MKRTVLALLLLIHALSVAAADKWTRVQTKNFTLVGNATENQIREVGEALEVFRTAFARFFNLKEGSSVATTVTVFRSDQAFKPFKPLYQGKPANLAGYFQPGVDMNSIVLAADMETPRVIYHEYVHRLMADNMASQPLWFQEGFAECFSSMEIEGRDKKVRLGRAIREHVELLNERRFLPLERLFAVTHDSPEYNEQEKQGIFYAESWALVHYMMFENEQRRNQFNAFLTALSRGTPAPRAFEDVFDMELPEFQKVFEAYIQQRIAWNLFQIQTPTGLDRSKDMPSKVMTEAEAEAHLGNMLMRIDRVPDAETHLAKAVKLDPKLGSAQAIMGRLQMEKGNNAEAAGFLKRAVELDPNNYLTHYYYASLLRRQKEPPLSDADRDTIRRELERTIELAPQFVEATEMLASENLTRNVDIVKTVELLAKALTVAPGRDYLTLQLANALTRTQSREAARPLAQLLLAKPNVSSSIKQNAQSVLSYLDRAQAADSANREMAERSARLNAEVRAGIETRADAVPTVPPELRRPEPVPGAPVVSDAPAGADRAERVDRRSDPLPAGTASTRGLLTLLDCKEGLTLSLIVDGKTLKFHSTTPNDIKFTSFNPAVIQTIACGPAPGNGVPAVIVYQPRESNGSLGNPVRVDFVESADANPRTAALPTIAGTLVFRGQLTLLECEDGVSLTVTSEGKTVRFRAASTITVAFMNGPNPDGTVTCGPLPGSGLAVAVVYRPTQSGSVLGDPLIVQFQGK